MILSMQKFKQYFQLHPLALKALRWSAVAVGVILLAILYVAVVGVSIDASGQREKLAAKLSQSLGREVRFDGVMQLEVSAKPRLRVGSVHIGNAQGFAGDDFISLGDARLELDLWPLLRLRFQIEELSGSDVQVHLQMKKGGSANWLFKPVHGVQPAKHEAQKESAVALESAISRLDIKRVSLQNLNVDFTGVNGRQHFFELQSLVAHLPAGEPVTMELHGKIEKTHPYQLEFSGGSISDLNDLDKPWPIDLRLGFMNSQLLLNGQLAENSGIINFAVGTQNLAEFEQLLQTRLPPVGAAYIAGEVKYEPGRLALESLGGHIGKTTLHGALKVDYTAAQPKIQGELDLPEMDLRPFMRDKPEVDKTPPKGLAEVYREIAKASFNLKALKDADADLTLRVGNWISLPGNVHDAKLKISLSQGLLAMPLQVSMAEVTLAGQASVDARKSPAKFNLKMGAQHSSLGNLAGLLMGMHGVNGKLGRFDLQVAARGDQGAELMRTLDVQLNVLQGKLSYGNAEGARPVQFELDKLELALPAGKALRGELQGSLLDKKFSATLRGSALTDLAKEQPAPLEFAMQAGSASARIHALLQAGERSAKSDVQFELSAPHSGEVANWFGLKPGADAPIQLNGSFHADSESWHLEDFILKLGRSDVALDIQRAPVQGRNLLQLKLNSELLDAEQMQALLPEPKKKTPAAEPAAGNVLDIPILPGGINLADADMLVSIKRINNASPIAVRDLNFSGQVRDGFMVSSPFSANIAEHDFSGAISLDLRTQQPHAVVWVAADRLDIGSVLKKIGIASKLEAQIEHASFRLDLNSSRLGDLLAQSELFANLEGGQFSLSDANTGNTMRIALDQGELKSAPGAPLNLGLRGSMNGAPVTIGIETAKAADLVNPKLPLPFAFTAATSGATIKLTGAVERPFTKKDIVLALEMNGSRFDNLNMLAQTSLPPWGPWSATGKFLVSQKGYEVSTLRLQVGSSELNGYGKFDTRSVPPRLDISLTAPTIQLDDFRLGNWSLEKRKAAAQADKDAEAAGNKAPKNTGQAKQILSADILNRQNASLIVKVDQVISGKDMLGNGKLEARLENGRASLGPVVVNTPGGSASFIVKYEPDKNDVLVSLRAEAKNFDYGILARRIDHKSGMSGTFSMDVDVNAHARYLADLFKNGKGHIDFAVWPENMKAGLLDLWAVNVLMALVPAVDSSNDSKVNCAIGRFVLADGKLSDKSMVIDTSRMRVTGKGSANFLTEEISFYAKPHAKTPQFLSLAIPVEVSGTFNDFSVGVRASDAAESVGQLLTSLVWVPLQMLFGGETPADGRDVCARAAFK